MPHRFVIRFRHAYDADHNLTEDGLYKYTVDAENRVIVMALNKDENELCGGEKRYLYTYDYLGRAVRQVVQVWNAVTEEWSDSPALGAEDRRVIYYEHLSLVELDGDDDNAVLVKYVWGPSLGGTGVSPVNSLGGPGSLIALRDASVPGNYVCFGDSGGNVEQVLDRSDGSIYANYGHDGPRDKALIDLCQIPPETFDDCDECTGPCFRGFVTTLRGLPEPHGVEVDWLKGRCGLISHRQA